MTLIHRHGSRTRSHASPRIPQTSSWCDTRTTSSSLLSAGPTPTVSGGYASASGGALTLHAGKTRLIAFGRHAAKDRRARGLGKPETFNFLGFTHISGHSRRGASSLNGIRSDRVRARPRRSRRIASKDA